MKQLHNIPGFASAQHDQNWNDTYLQLNEWVVKNSAAQQILFPSRYSADPEEKKLGVWIMNQRAAAKHSDQRCMTADRKPFFEAMPV